MPSSRRVVTAGLLLIVLALVAPTWAVAAPPESRNFVAPLSGDGEVPPRETRAHGLARFQLSADGDVLHYQLNVANIENVVASHIHLGVPGANGPAVAWLYGAVPAGGGRSDGALARGAITADDLVGPLAGQPLSALLDAMRSGGAYVNVHTNDGVAPANTGPGDFPGGEIRGQIRAGGAG